MAQALSSFDDLNTNSSIIRPSLRILSDHLKKNSDVKDESIKRARGLCAKLLKKNEGEVKENITSAILPVPSNKCSPMSMKTVSTEANTNATSSVRKTTAVRKLKKEINRKSSIDAKSK